MKEVDLGEPTSFHDNVYLVVVNENVKREKMLCANTSSWSYDMEGHAKICVERYCELANKTPQQPYKVTTPCLDDHQFKKKNWGLLDKWQNFVFELFSKCLYLARIGRPDILWPVNKLARTVTNWTNACDTFSRFDLLHTPHEWLQTLLSWGLYCPTVQVGTVSGLWFCRRSWRLESRLQKDFCAYLEVKHSYQEVGCVRNRLQCHTILQKLRLPLLMRVYAWLGFQLSIFGIWLLKFTILPWPIREI